MAPLFDMRSEVDLRLLDDPGGLAQCCDQLVCPRNELHCVTDAAPAVVAIRAFRHSWTLHQALRTRSLPPRAQG